MKILLASVRNPGRNLDGLTLYTKEFEALLQSIPGADVDHWIPGEPGVRRGTRSRMRSVRMWLTRTSKLPSVHRSDLTTDLVDHVNRTAPDVVFLNHIMTAWMGPQLRGVSKIYVAHNAEYLASRSAARLERGVRRVVEMLEASGRKKLEREILETCDGIVVLSHVDSERLGILSNVAGFSPTAVIPPAFETKQPFERKPEAVLLLGSFEWTAKQANARWLAKEVFPLVRQRVANPQLVIAGYRADTLGDLGGLPWVRLHPNPDNVEPLWSQAAVCAVPERQLGGVKLKVVEAVGFGVPVVSTSAGAEGTHLVPGRSVLIADDTATFAEHLVEVLTSPQKASDLSANAFMDMSTYPDKGEKVRRLSELVIQVVQAGQTG